MTSVLVNKPTVTLHYKIGTGMNMTDSMTPLDFSKAFAMRSAKVKWINALVDHFLKSESNNYIGLYLRWLYPGCPNVRILAFDLFYSSAPFEAFPSFVTVQFSRVGNLGLKI